jgi:hypothetical protein
MNFKKLLVCAGLLSASAFSVGCGGDDDGGGMTPPPPPPPPSCTAADLASGMSKFYVLNVLSLAGPEGDAPPFTSAGYNVDGDTAVACNSHIVGETAEFSGQAPDNGAGIDNALGGDLGNLANSSLQDSVDDASVLLLIEVKGVDNFTNDSCVGVNFYLGALPAGTMAPMLGSDGRLAPGQTFDISADSFTDGMAGTMPRIQFGSARIVAGRLQAGPADFPLALNLLGASLNLTIRDAQLRFNISDTEMSVGVLGGALNTMEVITTVNAIPDLAMYASVVEDTLTGLADIDENGSPDSCEAGSIALKLSGVSAVRGAVVAGAAP